MRFFTVRVENVSVNFGGKFALRNLNLDVEPGEIIGVLGPNGAGKTTFIKILLNSIKPNSGQINVLGAKSKKFSSNIRKKIGFLLPIIKGMKFLSARTYLQIFIYIYRKHTDKDGLALLADRLGVDLNKPVNQMESGELKAFRLMFAFLEPLDLIVLDEPTKDLKQGPADWYHRLIKVARAKGVSVIFTTSSVSEVERVCDWVVLMRNGKFISVERGVQFRGRSLRRVEMRFAKPLEKNSFASLPNIRELYLDGNKMRCLLSGDPDLLIKKASEMRVTDFISTPPTIDETMSLYNSLEINS